MQDARHTTTQGTPSEARSGRVWTRPLMCAAMMMIPAATLHAEPASARSERNASRDTGETVVRLYATAVVTGNQITLADLAEIRGEGAELAAGWAISLAPERGGSRQVDLDRVRKVLQQRGANLAYWVFRGSTRCKVTRPAAGYSSPADSHAPQTVNRALRSDADVAGADDDPTGGLPPDRNTLAGVLREHIAARLAHLGGDPLIEYTSAVRRLLTLSRPTYTFHVTDREDRLLGFVSLSVTIHENGEFQQTLDVLARVSLRKPVVVAARPLNRGESIQRRDLALEPRVFDRLDEIGLTEIGPLVGQRTTRFIDRGKQLDVRDLEPMPLVERNDLVTVIVRGPRFEIRSSAQAQTAGGLGDVVELKNALTRNRGASFAGVVTGHKTVEIRSEPAESTSSVDRLPSLAREGGS